MAAAGKRRFAAALLAAAVLGAAAWWAAATPEGGAASRAGAGPAAAGTSAGAGSRPVAGPDPRFLAPRSADQLANAQADPLLGAGLRDRLEALLQEALAEGATTDTATLKARLAGRADRHFGADVRERALALAGRYVDYRAALGRLRPPADLNDPRALRASLEERDLLRQQFFEAGENDALFAGEADLDRFTLARLEIEQAPGRTPEQKAQALRAAEEALPDDLRAARRSYVAQLAVAEQTASLDARNADDATRRAERSARYGEAAADALARLDSEDRQWQQRLDQYQQALSAQGDGPAMQQLRQRLFTPEEQLRLGGALAMRAARNPHGAGGG